jgi:hypothetical protein
MPHTWASTVGPACGKFAEFGHRGGLLVLGEVAPSGVVPGGPGELGDQEPVSSRRKTILVHLARIERASGYLKQAGELSRQSCSRVAVGSDIPGCQPPAGTASANCRQGTRTTVSSIYRDLTHAHAQAHSVLAAVLAETGSSWLPEWLQGPVRLVRINSLSWSPVTESNRRPSPYHGQPANLRPATTLDRMLPCLRIRGLEGLGAAG